MFAKIINQETKQCEVGLGTNTEFYKSIGMIDIEVEQSWDKTWYVKGYAPSKPQSVKEQEVRNVREKYLITYVDPIQLIIRWNSLTQEEQQDYTNYRQYLLDYPESSETWYEQNPKTFEEWLQDR